VGRYKAMTATGIKVFQVVFDTGNIADDARSGQQRQNGLESLDSVLHRYSVYQQFRSKFPDFFEFFEAAGIVNKTEFPGIYVVNGRFVLKTKDVGKETAHFAGTQY
jgi:hypothetical protein